MKKITVLEKLLADGIFRDEAEARAWVMTGRVLAGEVRVDSVFEKISPDTSLRVKELYKREFVGKGAFKLAGALDAFGVDPAGRVCFDCGASTGGFTDQLLSRGAAKVYAADTGFGMLAGKLRGDARVVNLERTNLGDEVLQKLDPKPTLATIDLSYLSLTEAYPLLRGILAQEAEAVLLVKPIFETRDREIRRSGKINDAAVLTAVFDDLLDALFAEGAAISGVISSPVRGNTGAVEFFLHAHLGAGAGKDKDTLMREAENAIGEALALPAFHKEQI